MEKTPFSMSDFEVEVKLYKKLKYMADSIEDEFDLVLSKKCKFQKVWIDDFDGEPIPKCYKVGKGKPITERMECTIQNCPLKGQPLRG